MNINKNQSQHQENNIECEKIIIVNQVWDDILFLYLIILPPPAPLFIYSNSKFTSFLAPSNISQSNLVCSMRLSSCGLLMFLTVLVPFESGLSSPPLEQYDN